MKKTTLTDLYLLMVEDNVEIINEKDGLIYEGSLHKLMGACHNERIEYIKRGEFEHETLIDKEIRWFRYENENLIRIKVAD